MEMEEDKLLHRSLSNLDCDSVVKSLSESEINIDFRDVTHGLQTILMRLCHVPLDDRKRREILYLILARNPAVNTQDSSGRTALMHACIAEKLDVIQALSSVQDCDPNIVDDDRNSALTYAVRSKNPSVVETLLLAFRDNQLDVNYRNSKGLTALEEAVAQLDSNISRLLVNLGGADSSVLKRDLLSPSPTRRNIDAVLHFPAPKSPLTRRRYEQHQRPDSLHSSQNESFFKSGSSPGWTGELLTVDTPSSRGSSRASSLDDVQEDDNEEEEEREYLQYLSNLHKQKRRNSLSLPDLRNIPPSLVSNSHAAGSLSSSMEHLSVSNPGSRFGSQQFKLPLLVEEEVDESSNEDIAVLSAAENTKVGNQMRRRNSVSLPDLRIPLQIDKSHARNTDLCGESASASPRGASTNSKLLGQRKQQFNEIKKVRTHEQQAMHTNCKSSLLKMKDKLAKKQINLDFSF